MKQRDGIYSRMHARTMKKESRGTRLQPGHSQRLADSPVIQGWRNISSGSVCIRFNRNTFSPRLFINRRRRFSWCIGVLDGDWSKTDEWFAVMSHRPEARRAKGRVWSPLCRKNQKLSSETSWIFSGNLFSFLWLAAKQIHLTCPGWFDSFRTDLFIFISGIAIKLSHVACCCQRDESRKDFICWIEQMGDVESKWFSKMRPLHYQLDEQRWSYQCDHLDRFLRRPLFGPRTALARRDDDSTDWWNAKWPCISAGTTRLIPTDIVN